MQGTVNPIHICIGAPRAGTTWLFNNLFESGLVFLPCIKEVRYWWGSSSPAEKRTRIAAHRGFERTSPEQLEWLNLWEKSEGKSAESYRALMGHSTLPSLDISPVYSTMPPDLIKALHDALPAESRVIMTVRNPYERNISAVRLHGYMHGRFRGPMADGTLIGFLESWGQQRRRDYIKTIRFWAAVFGERFRVFYYDDLKSNPEQFLFSVASYLNLADSISDVPVENTRKVVNTIDTKGPLNAVFTLSPSQEKMLAERSLRDARSFAAFNPEISGKWCAEILEKRGEVYNAAENLPQEEAVLDRLLRMSENLGETSDFALFQRGEGYEPSSLFRWSQTSIGTLIAFLRDPKADYTRTFPNLPVEDMGPQGAPQTPLAGWQDFVILREKFFFQLRSKPCFYVVQTPGDIPLPQLEDLLDALTAHNPQHRLVHITPGDVPDLCAVTGHLYQAVLPRGGGSDFQLNWRTLFEKIATRGEVKLMTEKMFV
jgi:hypothetical protein